MHYIKHILYVSKLLIYLKQSPFNSSRLVFPRMNLDKFPKEKSTKETRLFADKENIESIVTFRFSCFNIPTSCFASKVPDTIRHSVIDLLRRCRDGARNPPTEGLELPTGGLK